MPLCFMRSNKDIELHYKADNNPKVLAAIREWGKGTWSHGSGIGVF